MNKLSKVDIVKICNSYNQGLSSAKLARQYFVNPATIKYHLNKNSIIMRQGGFQKDNNFGVRIVSDPDIFINCQACNKRIRVWKSLLNSKNRKPKRFCSLKCRGKFCRLKGSAHPMWKGGLPQCLDCEKNVSSYATKRCKKCNYVQQSGPNHWNYKDGRGKNWRRNINYKEYRKWRKAVLARDNFKCKKCDSDKNLQAHHIVEWAKSVTLRYEISNGQTLCKNCHETHHKFKFKNW